MDAGPDCVYTYTWQGQRSQEYQGRNTGACYLHLLQSAFKPGKSTETSIQHVMTHMKEAVENSKIHLSFPRY